MPRCVKALFFSGFVWVAACSARSAEGGPPPRDSGATREDAGFDASLPPQRDSGPVSMRDAQPVDGEYLCGAPIDLVFVIDVSTSMRDELDQIRRGVDSVITAAHRLTEDTQLGLVVFVNDALTVRGCMPFASADALKTQLATWRDFCDDNVSPVSGSINMECAENSLDALYQAATECPWRAGATKVLIHATDDTFLEAPAQLSVSIPVEHTYTQVVEALRAQEIRVGAFAAPGVREYCGVGEPDTNVGVGFHESYMGQAAIPEATGGRVWSIREVRAGRLDMATAINELVSSAYCTIY